MTRNTLPPLAFQILLTITPCLCPSYVSVTALARVGIFHEYSDLSDFFLIFSGDANKNNEL